MNTKSVIKSRMSYIISQTITALSISYREMSDILGHNFYRSFKLTGRLSCAIAYRSKEAPSAYIIENAPHNFLSMPSPKPGRISGLDELEQKAEKTPFVDKTAEHTFIYKILFYENKKNNQILLSYWRVRNSDEYPKYANAKPVESGLRVWFLIEDENPETIKIIKELSKNTEIAKELIANIYACTLPLYKQELIIDVKDFIHTPRKASETIECAEKLLNKVSNSNTLLKDKVELLQSLFLHLLQMQARNTVSLAIHRKIDKLLKAHEPIISARVKELKEQEGDFSTLTAICRSSRMWLNYTELYSRWIEILVYGPEKFTYSFSVFQKFILQCNRLISIEVNKVNNKESNGKINKASMTSLSRHELYLTLCYWVIRYLSKVINDKNRMQIKSEKGNKELPLSAKERKAFINLAFVMQELIREELHSELNQAYKIYPMKLASSVLYLVEFHCENCIKITLPNQALSIIRRCLTHKNKNKNDMQFGLEHLQHIVDVYIFGHILIDQKCLGLNDNRDVEITDVKLGQYLNRNSNDDKGTEYIGEISKVYSLVALFHDVCMLENSAIHDYIDIDLVKNIEKLDLEGVISNQESGALLQFIKRTNHPFDKDVITHAVYGAIFLLYICAEYNDVSLTESYSKSDVIIPAARAILYHAIPQFDLSIRNQGDPAGALLSLADAVFLWAPSSSEINNIDQIETSQLQLAIPQLPILADIKNRYLINSTPQIKLEFESSMSDADKLIFLLKMEQAMGRLMCDGYWNPTVLFEFSLSGKESILRKLEVITNDIHSDISKYVLEWIERQKALMNDDSRLPEKTIEKQQKSKSILVPIKPVKEGHPALFRNFNLSEFTRELKKLM